jgi:hypothetical protein
VVNLTTAISGHAPHSRSASRNIQSDQIEKDSTFGVGGRIGFVRFVSPHRTLQQFPQRE